MSATRTSTVTIAAALAASCTLARAPAPVLLSVEPASVAVDATQQLVIRGRDFSAAVQADLDSPGASIVNAVFSLALVRGAARVPLAGVTLVSDVELRATLAAGSAAPGIYDLELVDPRGRVARLAAALTVYVRVCRTDGDPCDDGNACTRTDRCLGGVCVGSDPVVCAALDQCHVAGTCDPATGVCTDPAAPDGTPCSDGTPCTAPDACWGGWCNAGPWTCAAIDTAPLACFTVTPTAAQAGTVYTLDATCSHDKETPFSALAVRFDFDGSGAWYAAAYGTATHAYPEGEHVATVEVTDVGGLTAWASRTVVAVNPSLDLVVDTDLDETTPGDGLLSVREAFQIVSDPAAAGRTIRFAGPYRIAVSSPLPAVLAPGTRVVGRPGLVLDFGGAAGIGLQPCVTLAGPDQHLVGLEIDGCNAAGVQLSSTGAEVTECTIACAAAAKTCVLAGPSGGGAIGPGNDVSGATTGIEVLSAAWVADGNRVHGNVTGVHADGAAVVQRNTVFANGGGGLQLTGAGATVRFNVLDGNGRTDGASGVNARTASGVVFRNNLLTGNGSFGVAGGAGSFAALDHNGYFGNLAGAASPGLPLAASVLSDPLYVDVSRGDYRLLPGSPAVDAGVDVGLDVNGPLPGRYDGAAPDLGANESPY